jgi:hypothetical protein
MVLGIALAPAAVAQNLITNGDFDTDVLGWSAVPLPGGVGGTVTLTHDPEDALGLQASGSLRLEWDLSNPAGNFSFVRIAHSSCIATSDPAETFAWGYAARQLAVVSGDFHEVFFCQYPSPACTGAFLCDSVSVAIGPAFTFSPILGHGLQPTTQSINLAFDVELTPAGGGGNASEASYLFDKVFIRSSALPPPPLTVSANLLSLTGLTADFQGQTNGGTAPFPLVYSWDFGDGNASPLQNPAHTYATGGLYTVTFAADSGFEEASDQLLLPIGQVSPQAIPTISSLGAAVLFALLAAAAVLAIRRQSLR